MQRLRLAWGVVLVVGWTGAASRPARACDQIAQRTLSFATLPADGAVDVPRNVTPFVVTTDEQRNEWAGQRLEGPDGPVAAAVVDVNVVGEVAERLVRLVPAEPLRAATTYALVDDRGVVGSFSTGDGVDDDAPDAPVAEVVDFVAPEPDRTGFDCSVRGAAVLAVAVPPHHAALVARDTDPLLSAVLADVDPAGDLLVVSGVDFQARVALVDAAGHVSLPVRIDVDVPEPAALSCASAAGAGVGATPAAGVVLAALGLRRRRRR